MTVSITTMREQDRPEWDEYVHSNPDATFFHRAGWKSVLERAFGHHTHFFLARDGGKIVGVLPLAHIRSLLFGNSLTSLPFCVYGGIVADSEEASHALRIAACRLAEELDVGALELRSTRAGSAGWPVKDLYYTFRKAIDPDDEVNLKSIPNRQRAMIRKAINEGLASEWDKKTARLYRVYSESVRNLGTPVFHEKYLRILQEEFGSDCSILLITKSGRDVAAVMSFYFRDEVIPYYGGSTSEARFIKGVNHFMYWELMRRSREQGYRLFDFGRSKAGTGPFSFKKNYGFTPQALPYEYFLVKSDSVPDVNPLNPKYQMMVQAWSRLPLPVANFLGPFLARSLG